MPASNSSSSKRAVAWLRSICAVTFACLAGASGAQDWAEIPVAEARLVNVMPALRDVPIVQVRRSRGGRNLTQEVVTWAASPAGPPTAQLVYAQIDLHALSIFTDSDLAAIDAQVKQSFSALSPVTGEVGETKNVVGKGEYVMFEMVGRECVLFRVFDGWLPPDGSLRGSASANMLGRTRLDGWYCAVPSASLSRAEVQAFIQGAGIRGFAVPQ